MDDVGEKPMKRDTLRTWLARYCEPYPPVGGGAAEAERHRNRLQKRSYSVTDRLVSLSPLHPAVAATAPQPPSPSYLRGGTGSMFSRDSDTGAALLPPPTTSVVSMDKVSRSMSELAVAMTGQFSVLIVDSNRLARESMARVLLELGMAEKHVAFAKSGLEAMELTRELSTEGLDILLIMDMNMMDVNNVAILVHSSQHKQGQIQGNSSSRMWVAGVADPKEEHDQASIDVMLYKPVTRQSMVQMFVRIHTRHTSELLKPAVVAPTMPRTRTWPSVGPMSEDSSLSEERSSFNTASDSVVSSASSASVTRAGRVSFTGSGAAKKTVTAGGLPTSLPVARRHRSPSSHSITTAHTSGSPSGGRERRPATTDSHPAVARLRSPSEKNPNCGGGGSIESSMSRPFFSAEKATEESSDAYSAMLKNNKETAVLVVEDNPVNLKLMILMLERDGYSVTGVVNGQLAVDITKIQEFDVILMGTLALTLTLTLTLGFSHPSVLPFQLSGIPKRGCSSGH
jgi:CheY-like chemotaxis protein